MTLIGVLRAARRHGLRLHLVRLLDAPRVEGAPGSGSVQLRGVVCGVCAARTEDALRSVPGVEAATVDLEGSRAVLRLSPGVQVAPADLQRALEGVVVGMSVRRRIEAAARWLTGRTAWQRSSR
ncbi:MAG: heavy-metal-associated domain-containing protein [Dehalococcoidia bacterium]